eukprot:g2696.t1
MAKIEEQKKKINTSQNKPNTLNTGNHGILQSMPIGIVDEITNIIVKCRIDYGASPENIGKTTLAESGAEMTDSGAKMTGNGGVPGKGLASAEPLKKIRCQCCIQRSGLGQCVQNATEIGLRLSEEYFTQFKEVFKKDSVTAMGFYRKDQKAVDNYIEEQLFSANESDDSVEKTHDLSSFKTKTQESSNTKEDISSTSGISGPSDSAVMNRPSKLNAWTQSMMKSLLDEFKTAASDPSIKVAILSGKGRFYCAGVDLSSTMQPMMPKTLHTTIAKKNQELFDAFLDFPKPLIIAANGHAVGASVTSATLADAIVSVDTATFSTPFSALGICPEGCSSTNFAKLMGNEAAQRMLGPEGWKPSALDWKKLGVVTETVPSVHSTLGDPKQQELNFTIPPKMGYHEAIENENHTRVLTKAQEIAEQWIKEDGENLNKRRKRYSTQEYAELKAVNAKESIQLADCFLSLPFLEAQRDFGKAKRKPQIENVFNFLITTRPLWAKML